MIRILCKYVLERVLANTIIGLLIACIALLPTQAQEIKTQHASDPKSKIVDLIAECLQNGKEAVLFATKPPECFEYMRGRNALDSIGIQQPRYTDYETICRNASKSTDRDQRILDKNVIKVLSNKLRDSSEMVGFRIIGGIYCDGLDLRGLHTSKSVILDRSIFAWTVDARNFRTAGDLSVDASALHHNFYIIRADVAGSVYSEFSSVRRISIADSNIGGAVKLRYSTFYDRIVIESTKVDGDIDLSYSYFSYSSIIKNVISGMVDFGQTQARCSFDIRNNQLGGAIFTNFGFGSYNATRGPITDALYKFINIPEEDTNNLIKDDSLWKDKLDQSRFRSAIATNEKCDPINSVAPASFVFVDNQVKSSLCIRAPRWLQSENSIFAYSNLYLNENTISGATWLDLADRFNDSPAKQQWHRNIKNHSVGIFNLSTSTLIMNFDFKDKNAEIKINGLNFKRIYNSVARREASVSLRASKPLPDNLNEEYSKTKFPPDLKLPSPKQVLAWIQLNSFKATQPFSEFVSAFQQAGDLDKARDLKAEAAKLLLYTEISKLSCFSCKTASDEEVNSTTPESNDKNGSHSELFALDAVIDFFAKVSRWVEKLLVVLFGLLLWLLANHGFSPERIGWVIAITIATFFVLFHKWFHIVGFSVASEMSKTDPTTYRLIPKIHPIGIVFLFDHLLPAYKIRDRDYNVADYYVRSRDGNGYNFKYFIFDFPVEKASIGRTRKAERFLNILRFLGLIYVVFILAALGKIVQ